MSLVYFNTLLPLLCYTLAQSAYLPTWESLDSRKMPEWYDNAKIGIFMHWGVYSVPSFGTRICCGSGEWFWQYWHAGDKDYVNFVDQNYPQNFSYADFAHSFRAEFWNPDDWAAMIEQSGAKYFLITSKHHEGFCNWPNEQSWNWNSATLGPKRDLIGELENAIRKTSVKFGLYFSLFEWFHPLFLEDQANKFNTTMYTDTIMQPQIRELVEKYKPEMIWSDGDWGAPDTYWKSKEFLAWLFNTSPINETIVVNDRWGAGCSCHHGGTYTCSDRFHPTSKQQFKWENDMTLDKWSWGYRRNSYPDDILTSQELIYQVVSTIAYGGNIVVNVGPRSDGVIDQLFRSRLSDMGAWLEANGEGIYATTPWKVQNDSLLEYAYYTQSKKFKYIYVFIPEATYLKGKVSLSAPAQDSLTSVVTLLQSGVSCTHMYEDNTLTILFPRLDTLTIHWYYGLRLSGFK